jgi:hypothetical protein
LAVEPEDRPQSVADVLAVLAGDDDPTKVRRPVEPARVAEPVAPSFDRPDPPKPWLGGETTLRPGREKPALGFDRAFVVAAAWAVGISPNLAREFKPPAKHVYSGSAPAVAGGSRATGHGPHGDCDRHEKTLLQPARTGITVGRDAANASQIGRVGPDAE